MSKLQVRSFSVSLDGFGAGSAQALEHPLGVGGAALHEWLFATRTFQKTHHARAPVPMSGGTTFHFVTGVFTKRWRARRKPQDLETSVSVEAWPPSGNTSKPGWWTSCTWR